MKAWQRQGLEDEAAGEGDDALRARELLAALEVEEGGKFDYVGSALVVAAAVLSVFGLTDGGEGSGWYVLHRQPIHQLTSFVRFRFTKGSCTANHNARPRSPPLPGFLHLRIPDRPAHGVDPEFDMAHTECARAHRRLVGAVFLVRLGVV